MTEGLDHSIVISIDFAKLLKHLYFITKGQIFLKGFLMSSISSKK